MTRSHMFVFPLVIKKMLTKSMKKVNDIATTVFDTEGEYAFSKESNPSHVGKVEVR